jgi:hypothetical protein
MNLVDSKLLRVAFIVSGRISIAYSSSPLSSPPPQNPLEEKIRGEGFEKDAKREVVRCMQLTFSH